MALTETPVCEFGIPAPDFKLRGIDGKYWTLADCRGDKGTLVMFICNHCPYVKAVRERLVQDAKTLLDVGVKSAAIMSNDTVNYPEDSFENMKRIAAEFEFPFPYLLDETQEIARAYGAVCTPDFFGYNANLELQYRGRLDDSGMQPAPAGAPRELVDAMRQVANTGHGTKNQIHSIGCSIKWG